MGIVAVRDGNFSRAVALYSPRGLYLGNPVLQWNRAGSADIRFPANTTRITFGLIKIHGGVNITCTLQVSGTYTTLFPVT